MKKLIKRNYELEDADNSSFERIMSNPDVLTTFKRKQMAKPTIYKTCEDDRELNDTIVNSPIQDKAVNEGIKLPTISSRYQRGNQTQQT